MFDLHRLRLLQTDAGVTGRHYVVQYTRVYNNKPMHSYTKTQQVKTSWYFAYEQRVTSFTQTHQVSGVECDLSALKSGINKNMP